MANVKCADCGYLAVRHRTTRQLYDAEESLRVNGELPILDNRGYVYDEWPVCFVRAANFRVEMEDNSATPHRKRVLNQPRECDQFTPWHQGFSPKEHVEMKMLDEQKQWQRDEAAEQRRWQERQTELAEKHHRVNFGVALLAALIGAVATLAAVLVAKWIGQ